MDHPITYPPSVCLFGLVLALVGAPAAQNQTPGGNTSATEQDSGLRSDEGFRKSQAFKRKSGSKRFDFDPRVYEARGRELEWEFYEIGEPAELPPPMAQPVRPLKSKPASRAIAKQPPSSVNWMLWGGALGLTGAAGVFLLMEKKPPPGADRIILITDDPKR